MTTEWIRAAWSDALEGTRIKVTSGKNEIVGVLEGMSGGAHVLRTDMQGSVEIGSPGLWNVSIEKVPAVVLPTKPGWYWDKDGDPWQIDEGGDRLHNEYAPYIRIRPESEIAAEVLTQVRNGYMPADPTYWGRLDAIAAEWATK